MAAGSAAAAPWCWHWHRGAEVGAGGQGDSMAALAQLLGTLLRVRLLGLGGISTGRRCFRVRRDAWGKQGSSGEESGSGIWDPLHLAQDNLALFISFLLGMWNRESIWKELDSH